MNRREDDEDDRRAKVVKKDDHLCDALRYLAMSKPLPKHRGEREQPEHPLARLLREDLERCTHRDKHGQPTGLIPAGKWGVRGHPAPHRY